MIVEQITKGIKVSVKTSYNGSVYRNHMLFYNFEYYITIENKSLETVQLKERFWRIFDSLNKTEFVNGQGVVGQTPILAPNDSYTYKSFCLLTSQIGCMNGYFTMINVNLSDSFRVTIPSFQLSTPTSLN